MRPGVLALSLLVCTPALAQVQEGPVPQNPLARDPWVGTWKNDELVMTIERRGDGYGGTIELGDQRFPFVARRGAALDGTFTSDGHAFPFTARLEGDTLVLSSGGVDRRLRQATPGPARAGGGPAGGGSAPAGWQTYRNALGYQLRYPPGWQLAETDAGLLFTPPDLARDAQGQPLEVILVCAVPAQGVTRPDDPRAVQFVEAQLQEPFPFLRRGAAPVVRELGGRPTAELSLAGVNPLGKPLHAVALVTLLGDQAVVGVVVAEPERARARAETLRAMIGSAGRGEAQRDGRLVGTWRHERHDSSGTFSSTSIRTITLRADGVCLKSSRTFASMDHQDAGGGESAHTSADTGESSPDRGSWAADGRRLVMQWGDGTVEEWEYELGSRSMLLEDGSNEPRLYQRVN